MKFLRKHQQSTCLWAGMKSISIQSVIMIDTTISKKKAEEASITMKKEEEEEVTLSRLITMTITERKLTELNITMNMARRITIKVCHSKMSNTLLRQRASKKKSLAMSHSLKAMLDRAKERKKRPMEEDKKGKTTAKKITTEETKTIRTIKSLTKVSKITCQEKSLERIKVANKNKKSTMRKNQQNKIVRSKTNLRGKLSTSLNQQQGRKRKVSKENQLSRICLLHWLSIECILNVFDVIRFA